MAVTISGSSPTFSSGYAGGVITSGTAVASTSGTSIDFTSIPSWVKRVTVMFNGVSTNGSSVIQIQVGSGSVSTSGYFSTSFSWTGGNQGLNATSGIVISAINGATSVYSGAIIFTLQSSNSWVAQGNTTWVSSNGSISVSAGNTPNLAGALDRVRITTVNGTDTFDAGSINILYE